MKWWASFVIWVSKAVQIWLCCGTLAAGVCRSWRRRCEPLLVRGWRHRLGQPGLQPGVKLRAEERTMFGRWSRKDAPAFWAQGLGPGFLHVKWSWSHHRFQTGFGQSNQQVGRQAFRCWVALRVRTLSARRNLLGRPSWRLCLSWPSSMSWTSKSCCSSRGWRALTSWLQLWSWWLPSVASGLSTFRGRHSRHHMVRGWSSSADRGTLDGRGPGLPTVGRCRMWSSEDVAWVLSWLTSTATWRMQRPHSCYQPLAWKPQTFGKLRSRPRSSVAGRCQGLACWNFSGGCWCRSGYLSTQLRQPHTIAWGGACQPWQIVCWCRRMNCRLLVIGRSCRKAAMVTPLSRSPRRTSQWAYTTPGGSWRGRLPLRGSAWHASCSWCRRSWPPARFRKTACCHAI